MFSGFTNLFHNIGHAFNSPPQSQQHHDPPPPSNYKTPPASKRVLATLPQSKVTADDILEATNKECLICLEEQKIGSWACKLQCGHLFHKNCLAEWLEKHCTCPVCRFELETDDTAYESERKKRMKNRKLRLRMDEISSKSVAQLREISQNLNININGCIDKSEIVDKLVKSGGIEITEGMPPIEITEEEFNSKTVSQLKYLLLSFGISDRDAIEKSELRSRLLSSGRIIFKPVTKCDGTTMDANTDDSGIGNIPGSYGDLPSSSGAKASAVSEECGDDSGGNGTSGMDMGDSSDGLQPPHPRGLSSSESPSPTSPTADAPYFVLLSDLRAFSLTELQDLCARYQVSTSGCVEKAELIERLLDSGYIRLLDVHEQLAAIVDDSDSSSSTSVRSGGGCEARTKIGGGRTSIGDSAEEFGPSLPPLGSPIVVKANNNSKESALNYIDVERKKDGDNNAYSTTTTPAPADNGDSTQNSSANNRKGPSAPIFTGRINAYDEPTSYSVGNSSSSSSDAYTAAQEMSDMHPQDSRLTLSVSLLTEMSVREVRSIMDAYNINSAGCLEKTDMIARIQDCNSIRVVN